MGGGHCSNRRGGGLVGEGGLGSFNVYKISTPILVNFSGESAIISLHMTIRHYMKSFWTKFDRTSLLAIFQFWSTYWLKWTKISADHTIYNMDHLESF